MFSMARHQCKYLVNNYTVSHRVLLQLMGYAFKGMAKTDYLAVTSDLRNAMLTVDGIWAKMADNPYISTIVSTQRSSFTAVMLR